MASRNNSDLDKSATMNVEDFTKAFELNNRLERAVKFIVRYSQHPQTKAGQKNLERALKELATELYFRGGGESCVK